MKVLLFGKESGSIKRIIAAHPQFELVEANPEVVVCYGGDGTLLTAERRWPGVPKIPIRNSDRGNRLIARSPQEVIDRFAKNDLVRTEFVKIACSIHFEKPDKDAVTVVAMNEVNVHMGNINSAVRVKVWFDDEAFNDGAEILGDGLIVSTPFGSTAYYNKITRSEFYAGLGIAFNNTSEHTSHVVVPDDTTICVRVTRGPAVLSYDNSNEYVKIKQNDTLTMRKHEQPATIFTWEEMSHPSHNF